MNTRLIAFCSTLALFAAPAAAQTYAPESPPLGPPAATEAPGAPQYNAPADPRRVETTPMPAPDSPGGIAPDRTDLGRDCVNARTRVDQTICKNEDLRLLDRDVARLAGVARGDAGQQAWVRSLDACERASNTVYDGPIYNCLRARYEARIAQLARRAGGAASGQYRLVGDAIAGNMTLVEWPQQQQATVIFNKITTSGARACGIRMDVPMQGGVIEGSPRGLPGCRVAVTLGRGTATVQSNGCHALCEMGERVDGTYVSLGDIAPAAGPRRTSPAPAPAPAAPKGAAPRY